MDGFYTQPPVYENTRSRMMALKRQYPFLRVFSIGKSVLGRNLHAVGFGPLKGCNLLVGGVHGTEWITTLLLFRLLEDLAYSIAHDRPLVDVDIARSLEYRGLVIVPALDPDGILLSTKGAPGHSAFARRLRGMCGGDFSHWQANANGVDLNHNFDAGWQQLRQMEEEAGITGPGPTRYGGPRPASEPETRALCSFCGAFDVRAAYAFHSQGEEIYYRYGEHTPARARMMAQLLADASGYRVAHPQGLASHGGFKDWFIETFHRPGFTIEVGRGQNPLPITELEPLYARLIELLLLTILL